MKISLRMASCLVAFGAFALAGCAQNSMMSNTKTFTATLNGAQEVPSVPGSGTGTATFKLDTTTKMLTWNVSYSGLSGPAAAAHIHAPAAAGTNAGVAVNLSPGGAPANPITGSATVTDGQIADMMAGKAYVNIHTAKNKGGEIRGQIAPGM
ncbi:MAG TPA: CHRD domain-containing protein [Stellaceae bacterium]|nr:CHRD domain-containing protein [Stellaceae bacterium]